MTHTDSEPSGLNAPGDGQIGTADLALAFFRRLVAQRYDKAEAALLAGSRARGEAAAGSDYDVVLLFAALPDGAWRETILFEGQPVEVFAYDLGTLAYFCRQVDRPSGRPVLLAMVSEGIPVSPRPCPLLDAARAIADEVLRLGPPPLSADAVQLRRYAITDLAAALQGDRGQGLRVAAGAALYTELADFALRSAGRWTAAGKAFPRALAGMDPALAARFEAAFAALFTAADAGPVQALVDSVLMPHGGRLRVGFRRKAPAAWREATDLPSSKQPGGI